VRVAFFILDALYDANETCRRSFGDFRPTYVQTNALSYVHSFW
jgi:hypothetical protein